MNREERVKKEPLVSICLITYNHEKYIQQSVDSILSQHMNFSYELLIADDASTDRTQEILWEKYSGIDNVQLILRRENSKGKNAYLAVQKAKGKYIYYCEGDDYWLGEDGLQTLVDWLKEHKEYAGVCGRRITLSEKTGLMSVNYERSTENSDVSMNDFLENRVNPDLCAMLFRNFYGDGKHNYKTYLASREVGDLTTIIYILLHGKIFQLDKIVGVYRSDRYRTAGSYNTRTSPRKMFEEHMKLLSNLPSLLSVKLDFSRKRKVYADWYISSIQSSYEFVSQIPYFYKHLGIRIATECLLDWVKRNKE